MKIRRPDADKARKQLERQHIAAADRAAKVARPRSAPAGFRGASSAEATAEAMQKATVDIGTAVGRMVDAFAKARGVPVSPWARVS